MRFIALLATVACAPAPEAVSTDADFLPVEEAGALGGWATLSQGSLLVTNTTGYFNASGFPAGITINLLGSGNVAGPGMCPGAIAPNCVDLAAPYRLLGSAVTDGAGNATFAIAMPNLLPPNLEFMAYGRGPGGWWVTNGFSDATYAYANDYDGDGLSNGYEYDNSINLLAYDTDGGGVGDGDEVANGTDPWNAGDDMPSACSGYAFDAGNGMGCWYTAPSVGMTCDDVCSTHGGFDAATSQHSGNQLGMFFWPGKANGSNWVEVECSSTDNNTNWGANGGVPSGTWSHPACHVNCSCAN
jgi:hypothetical protein